MSVPGQVYGLAGSGLVDASWAASKRVADVGRKGEIKTAVLLNEIARRPDGPSVFHHVVPRGSSADVDHVVVSGNHVLMVDSKAYLPAFYWTFGGVHYRSRSLRSHERAEFVPDEGYIERSRRRMERTLEGTGAVVDEAVFAVWPSRKKGRIFVGLLRLGENSRLVHGEKVAALVQRWAKFGSADPKVVRALVERLGE